MKLLSKPSGNAKIAKSLGDGGFWGTIMHLAPYTLSGKNTCSHASPGCAAACLNTGSYYTNMDSVQNARIAKTKLFFEDRDTFRDMLYKEIAALVRQADRKGFTPAMRLNGTSDLPWENIFPELFDDFKCVQFYDYTKVQSRMLKSLTHQFPANYHLTFSKSEVNWHKCLEVLAAGGNVAAVFAPKIPDTYEGYSVINGDESDFRFLDQRGVIVGLKAKGKAKNDDSGFTIRLVGL